MVFDQHMFDEFVLNNGVIGFFEKPITLKSGRKSNWYVNWRNVAGDAFYLLKLQTKYILTVMQKK